MPRAAVALTLAVVLACCGGGDSQDEEQAPPKRLVVLAADQMVEEAGAEFDATLRSKDGRFEVHRRGRAELGLLRSHVIQTYEEWPEPGYEGFSTEVIYGRALSYYRRPGERRWMAFRAFPWGPAQRVGYLPEAATALRRNGKERVLGVETTRIDGIWDARRLASEVPVEDRRSYRSLLRDLRRPRMPLTVWIDRRRRIRQLRLEAELQYLFGFRRSRIGTETFRFRRFDSRIDIDPPLREEIRNWAEIAP